MTSSSLDTEELLHIAIAESRANDHAGAITHLKQLLSTSPGHADATFLLAAMYAEVGMFDRAEETMRKALDLNPALHTARLQLGQLRYRAGDLAGARAAWAELSQLDEHSAVRLFAESLLALADDQPGLAESLLDRATADQSNPGLHADVVRLLERIRSGGIAAAPPAPATAQRDIKGAAAEHYLANYEQHSEDPNKH